MCLAIHNYGQRRLKVVFNELGILGNMTTLKDKVRYTKYQQRGYQRDCFMNHVWTQFIVPMAHPKVCHYFICCRYNILQFSLPK